MSDSIRSVTIADSRGHQTDVQNLIGLDESTSQGCEIVVAVRCAREQDISLVRALIENDLKPFRYKSSSILRHGDLDRSERISRVKDLISDLQGLSITWAAIICPPESSQHEIAAATSMAVKKSITDGLREGVVTHGCGDTGILHDGAYDPNDPYLEGLGEIMPSHFDTSFQRSICPVYLAFLREADLIYPQNTIADYIAGYLNDRIEDGASVSTLPDPVRRFDNSWVDRAPQPEQIYHLEEFQPVREEEVRSRVIAWMTGRGYPDDPVPTTQDPYRDLVEEIQDDDEVVYRYLCEEI
ncbi:hypothetical protein [Natronoarchaeum rubrum]|uniref:hypothetical protein n=1 Tax=Natronoarchaeum rubrum TaxID=755311 RepID=UPI00211322CE|nr:hypothetical protein [Natronoarchaeum rubrum]